jgi:hypothetical protein
MVVKVFMRGVLDVFFVPEERAKLTDKFVDYASSAPIVGSLAKPLFLMARCAFSDKKITLEDAIGIPRMFACNEHACDQWHSSRKFTLLPLDTVHCVATLKAIHAALDVMASRLDTALFATFELYCDAARVPGGLAMHGAWVSTECFTPGSHWFPRLFT